MLNSTLLLAPGAHMLEYRKKPITIGVLSDTHLWQPSDRFRALVAACFADVDLVLHAGDLTSLSVLGPFGDKEVHAVCGNMCDSSVAAALPRSRVIRVAGFSIALCHGDGGPARTVEARLRDRFAPVDCIVYGHTHTPVCHRRGPILFVNPGGFLGTGRAAGTYAIIEAGKTLKAEIRTAGAGR